MLTHLDKKNILKKMLVDAIIETSKHRKSYYIVNNKNDVEDVINSIKNDKSLKEQWSKYQRNYEYAKEIEFGVRIDIWTHLMRGCIIELCTLH